MKGLPRQLKHPDRPATSFCLFHPVRVLQCLLAGWVDARAVSPPPGLPGAILFGFCLFTMLDPTLYLRVVLRSAIYAVNSDKVHQVPIS
jgi:hypothetical protein